MSSDSPRVVLDAIKAGRPDRHHQIDGRAAGRGKHRFDFDRVRVCLRDRDGVHDRFEALAPGRRWPKQVPRIPQKDPAAPAFAFPFMSPCQDATYFFPKPGSKNVVVK